jgi:regulatory protein
MGNDTRGGGPPQPEPVAGRVTRLRARRRGVATEIEVEGASWAVVATEVALAEALAAGTVLDEARSRRILDADALWRAREAALRLLSYRPRTREELARRLAGKGFRGAVVDRCLDRLDEAGLIDDRAFAEAFVRDRLRARPKGRRALLHELRTRGVGEGVAREALDQALGDSDEEEIDRARRAADRWRRRPGEEEARACRRLAAYLGRRGFPGDIVRQVVEERVRGTVE